MREKALQESINHWWGNYTIVYFALCDDNNDYLTLGDMGYKTGPDNCALCNKYSDYGCDGCPVMNKTEESLCHTTPYYATPYYGKYANGLTKEDLQAVLNEVKFLEEL